MYTVYIDGKPAYSPLLLPNEGYGLLSAKVTKKLNKAGSFNFILPPNNTMYDSINKLKSIIEVISTDEPVYTIYGTDKISKSTQTSIPTTKLYKDAVVDSETGEIKLQRPFGENGVDAYKQYLNYKEYPYFYGDLENGTQDSKVYKYTSINRTISSGSSGGISIAFYSYTYYLQDAQKTIQEKEIFRGRALYTEKDFYKRKTVVCEGELAFLLDSIQRPYVFQGDIPVLYTQLITNHNSQVDDWKQFQAGTVTVTDKNNYIHRESTTYPCTFNEIKEKLIDTHGGYLKIRVSDKIRYLDYLEDSGKVNTQVIEFGKNLLDITEYITAENVFTVLVPLGARQENEDGEETGRLTIESLNDGKDYLESEIGINLFGRIVKTHVWDDVTLADNLLDNGNELLNSSIEMAIALKIKAVDLHLINVNVESISVGDYIRVISPPHNLDAIFQCTSIEIDLLKPENSVYEFGISFSSLTEKLNKKV
ncbi:MAG: phage tail spike protein [Blautia sp.]